MSRAVIGLILVIPIVTGCGKSVSSTGTTSSSASSAASGLSGQKFTFGRNYKVGDKDVYSLKMDQSTAKEVVTMTMTQEITKVYENGDADMKQTSSDMVMSMGGKDTPVPAQQPTTMRVDKYGSPQGGANGSVGGGYAAAVSQMKDGISLGQTVPYSAANPANPGSHDVGKITYVSADGASKFHVVSDITDAKGATTHMEGDMSLDTVSKKPLSMDMTMTMAGTTPGTTHIVMTRKTP